MKHRMRFEPGTECVSRIAVDRMMKHYGIAYDGPPRELPEATKDFRLAGMAEELDEYRQADPDDLVSQYDALLDLLVFTIGTLHEHGFPMFEGFRAVMDCNMQKIVGTNSKRGDFKFDLRKPHGFVGPEERLKEILDAIK
jgi:predicted HAD superfamily Cof-like phosphohydrolase